MEKTLTETIYQAARDLDGAGQAVTRETLQAATGLSRTEIIDRVTALLDDGRLERVSKGLYRVGRRYPRQRPISLTMLGDGCAKVEIGDEVLTLIPAELRALGLLTAGAAIQLASIEGGMAVTTLTDEFERRLRATEQHLRANERRLNDLSDTARKN